MLGEGGVNKKYRKSWMKMCTCMIYLRRKGTKNFKKEVQFVKSEINYSYMGHRYFPQ